MSSELVAHGSYCKPMTLSLAESLGELKVRLKNWKDQLEEKALKVNVGKTCSYAQILML